MSAEDNRFLRLLGVRLESAILFKNKLRNWAALQRVYQLAARMAPDDAWVYASQGLSAAELAERASWENTPEVVEQLFSQAHSALQKAAGSLLAP